MKNTKKYVLVIWPFWNSDLYVKDPDTKEFKTINGKDFLSKTKEIKENYDKYKNDIDFLIFRQFVNQFIPKDKYENVIVKWIFTDQPHHTDTIHLKEIFKRWLKNKLPKIRFANDHVVLEEANNTELILNYFKEQIKIEDLDLEKVIVSITGWTKWIVSALILYSIYYFPLSKLSLVYWKRVEDSNETVFMKQDVIKDVLKSNLQQVVETKNYEAIKLFIEQNNIKDEQDILLIYNVVNYWLSRLSCDFDSAIYFFRKSNLPSKFLISKNTMKQLEEAINWIIYTIKHGYWVEFMWRIYNFLDKILINEILAKKVFDDLKSISDWITYDELSKFVKNNPKLEEFLNKVEVKNWEYISLHDFWNWWDTVNTNTYLKWDPEKDHHLAWKDKFINTIVWLALLDYFSSVENKIDRKLFEYAKKLSKLAKYRNKTVIWHWLDPINEDVIKENLWTNDIMNFFKDIFNELLPEKSLWIEELDKELDNKIKKLKKN